MKIGVPRETKTQEYRVALTPKGASALVNAGHHVVIELAAGRGAGFSDADYQQAGATIGTAHEAWGCELVLKVKEPVASEYAYLQQQTLFTYLHLAGVDPALTETMLTRKTTAIAYETVEDAAGKLPLLAPMSAVAGSMAMTMGNYYLARFNGGKGMLLSQLFDRHYGKVLVIGDGVVGQHSARVAASMGAEVLMAGHLPDKTERLAKQLSTDIRFVQSNEANISAELSDVDLLVGAVLARGARARHVVSEAMVQRMQPGSVIVDVSIDQGGCIETSRATTHDDPVYEKHGVIHYCVANMPGAYPRLATLALTEATLPYAIQFANHGIAALQNDAGFARGLNIHEGFITYEAVASSLGLTDHYRPFAAKPRAGDST